MNQPEIVVSPNSTAAGPYCLDESNFSRSDFERETLARSLDLPANSSSSDPLRLLLVEDDEDDYYLIQDLLSEAEQPFELEWVTSFEAAVAMLEHRSHDIYLVDYRLGAEDGLALMAKIQCKHHAPVIILSGQGDRALDIAALKLGASDYLDKSNLQASLLEHYIRASVERNAALNALKESEQRYRQLFKQERSLRRQLSESNAELEQFAFIASHDLREPLRAIAGHTHLLMDEYSHLFDETATEYMAFILNGAQRMQALIRDLLRFSQIQAVPIDPNSKVDCNQAVQNALTNLQSAIVESNAVITCEALPTVSGDLSHVTRLFQNLIDNAIKFRRPNAQPHVSITVARINLEKPTAAVSAASSATHWQIGIKDNGIGIDSRYADQVFQAFKRLHTQQEIPGTGIGLATCQHIVQRHGGKIWLESEVGQGSIVHFTLRNSV
ncbi:MAG: ATP-binding protein [Elainellaceae cyanobacterium]